MKNKNSGIVLLIVLFLQACSLERPESLEWTTGQVGGGWYTMGAGFSKFVHSENPGISLKIVPGGGTINSIKIQNGRSQLGWGLDALVSQAVLGEVLYEGNPHTDLMMIGMSFSDIYTHFVRKQDAKYRSIEDILVNGRDVKIGVIKAGSSDEKIFSWLMEMYGTSYEDLRKNRNFKINHGNVSELSSQFKDGQIDYVFINQGLPASAIIEMSQSRDLTLIPFTEEILATLNQKYRLYRGEISAETYGIGDQDILTIKMGTALLVHKSVSTETVYSITRSLCENQSNLSSVHGSAAVFDCASSFNNPPAPIHPGALKYFKEKNFM